MSPPTCHAPHGRCKKKLVSKRLLFVMTGNLLVDWSPCQRLLPIRTSLHTPGLAYEIWGTVLQLTVLHSMHRLPHRCRRQCSLHAGTCGFASPASHMRLAELIWCCSCMYLPSVEPDSPNWSAHACLPPCLPPPVRHCACTLLSRLCWYSALLRGLAPCLSGSPTIRL